MKHVPQDKYNVAWFTLAECITRREKVRALGVYRLLSHSIDDMALRYQLEGDILLAFDDLIALEKYCEAAHIYQKEGRSRESIAVYEHLHTLDPEKNEYLNKLIDLYSLVQMKPSAVETLKKLLELYLRQERMMEAEEVLTQLEVKAKNADLAQERYMFMLALIRSKNASPERLQAHLHTTIEALIFSTDSSLLQRFLSTLDALDPQLHKAAVECVQAVDPTK